MTVTSAVIPASGRGKRLGSDTDKAFVPVAGRPLLAHTLSVFQHCPEIDEIVLVVRDESIGEAENLVREYGISKIRSVVTGGDERQDSVRNGLARLSPECDIVAIHDAARPLVTPDIIASSIEVARDTGAAIVAVPVIDTIKSTTDGVSVAATLDRGSLYAVQTPQTFARDVIESAYEQAAADGYKGTDDASLVERLGRSVRIVQGSYENIKVTTPIDITLAEAIMTQRQELPMDGPAPAVRVGHGYDIHRFAPGRKLFLGGIEFPDEEGLLGHSDADVLLHAVSDALLGAAGAGDIGRHFPDTDTAYKDARSTDLLARVGDIVRDLGWRVENVDVTLIAERPRIARHAPAMCDCIAGILRIAPGQVSVKGRTAEKLGPIGEGQGIECHAVVLLSR